MPNVDLLAVFLCGVASLMLRTLVLAAASKRKV